MKLKTPPPSSNFLNVSIDERVKEFIGGAKKASIPAEATPDFPKETVIRDGFSMPLDDYKLIDQARRKALSLGLSDIEGVTKSHILRVALRLLEKTSDEDFINMFELTKPERKKNMKFR